MIDVGQFTSGVGKNLDKNEHRRDLKKTSWQRRVYSPAWGLYLPNKISRYMVSYVMC